jgi:hypothetical protein
MNFRSWAVAGRGQTSPIGRLDAIADNLNTRPRATHYWPTSPEVFCANTGQFSQGLHFGSLTPVAHSVLKHPVLYTMTVEFHNPGRVKKVPCCVLPPHSACLSNSEELPCSNRVSPLTTHATQPVFLARSGQRNRHLHV